MPKTQRRMRSDLAFMEPGFEFTEATRADLAGHLGGRLREGVALEAVLTELQSAIESYLGLSSIPNDKLIAPTEAERRKQVIALRDSLAESQRLLDTLDPEVSHDIEAMVRRWNRSAEEAGIENVEGEDLEDGRVIPYGEVTGDLRRLKRPLRYAATILAHAARHLDSKTVGGGGGHGGGRHPGLAENSFGQECAGILSRNTTLPITISKYDTGGPGPWAQILVIVCEMVGIEKGDATKLARRVVDERRRREVPTGR